MTKAVEGTLSLTARPCTVLALGLGFARPREGGGPGNLEWLFHSGFLIPGCPPSCVITSVTLPRTATRTRVSPQPHPESKDQTRSHSPNPALGQQGTPTQALPASLISLPRASS